MPPDLAAAWSRYIAALLEWALIEPDDPGRLLNLLPRSAAAAVLPIFLGHEDSVSASPAKAVRVAG